MATKRTLESQVEFFENVIGSTGRTQAAKKNKAAKIQATTDAIFVNMSAWDLKNDQTAFAELVDYMYEFTDARIVVGDDHVHSMHVMLVDHPVLFEAKEKFFGFNERQLWSAIMTSTGVMLSDQEGNVSSISPASAVEIAGLISNVPLVRWVCSKVEDFELFELPLECVYYGDETIAIEPANMEIILCAKAEFGEYSEQYLQAIYDATTLLPDPGVMDPASAEDARALAWCNRIAVQLGMEPAPVLPCDEDVVPLPDPTEFNYLSDGTVSVYGLDDESDDEDDFPLF